MFRTSNVKRFRYFSDEQANRIVTHQDNKLSRFRWLRLAGGLLFSSIIGVIAYRRRSLTRSGIAGAIVSGTTTFGLGGLTWGLALIYFFVSSSLLSHFRARDKSATAADKFSKGSQRDISQVAANGGVATLLALGNGLSQSPAVRNICQAGYIGSLATANADTWATELGILNRSAPRLITNGQQVAPGTSGGVTPLGTAAAASGALSLGLLFQLMQRRLSLRLPVIALVSGLAGSLFDSFMGATVQAIYFCPACQQETERRIHSCGTTTRPQRGVRWIDNDVVNFLATLVGAGIAMLLSSLFRSRSRRL